MKILQHQRKRLPNSYKTNGFTLIEVLVALSITAIGLVTLLHLLITSINMVDSASCLSRASLIGNAKLAEVISRGYPELGIESGISDYEDNNIVFKWQVNVTIAQEVEFEELNIKGLRKVNVSVIWDEGKRKKQVSMSTFICPNQEVTDIVLLGKGN